MKYKELLEEMTGKDKRYKALIEKMVKDQEEEDNKPLQVDIGKISGVSVLTLKGEKGRDADESRIVERVLSRIPKPKDGKDSDTRQVIKDVLAKIPKPKDGKDAEVDYDLIVKRVKKLIPIPQDGKDADENKIVDRVLLSIPKPKDGEDGKDGSPDEPKDIKKKLETLKGEKRLDASAIKNLPRGGDYGGGVSRFTSLWDTPDNFVGKAGQLVRVQSDEKALEFVESETIEDVNWSEIGGTLADQTDLQDALDSKADSSSLATVATSGSHGDLTELAIDDHTQYALLAGRAGGQTLVGGSAVTDILKLQGTSGNGTLTSPAIQALVGNNGGTVAYTVLNNGNVGIGTTSPGAKLDVNGNVSISGSLDFATGGYIKSGGANAILIGYPYPTFVFGFYSPLVMGGTAASSNLVLRSTSGAGTSDYIAFQTGSQSEQVRITSGGNVGIGTTSPREALDIGTGYFRSDYLKLMNNEIFVVGNNSDTSLYINRIGYNGGTTQFRNTYIGDGKNNNIMYVQGSSGNVGIGTTNPNASSILHLSSTTKGFLPPVMTGTQAEAISSPATGLMVYASAAGSGDITAAGWWGYNGANWIQLG